MTASLDVVSDYPLSRGWVLRASIRDFAEATGDYPFWIVLDIDDSKRVVSVYKGSRGRGDDYALIAPIGVPLSDVVLALGRLFSSEDVETFLSVWARGRPGLNILHDSIVVDSDERNHFFRGLSYVGVRWLLDGFYQNPDSGAPTPRRGVTLKQWLVERISRFQLSPTSADFLEGRGGARYLSLRKTVESLAGFYIEGFPGGTASLDKNVTDEFLPWRTLKTCDIVDATDHPSEEIARSVGALYFLHYASLFQCVLKELSKGGVSNMESLSNYSRHLDVYYRGYVSQADLPPGPYRALQVWRDAEMEGAVRLPKCQRIHVSTLLDSWRLDFSKLLTAGPLRARPDLDALTRAVFESCTEVAHGALRWEGETTKLEQVCSGGGSFRKGSH